MYNTVKELHIALDFRLQQMNSNRKQAFAPEQYDVALNDAILTVVKKRCSAKLNSKQEGFEESIKRYEDLQSLKRDCKPDTYFVDNHLIFDLPSNYHSYDTLIGDVKFNKNGITSSNSAINNFCTVVNFSNVTDYNITSLVYTLGSGSTINTDSFIKLVKSKNSLFYYFNLVRDYIKDKHDIDCYFENYDGQYYANSIIFVTSDYNKRCIAVNNNIISLVLYSKTRLVKTIPQQVITLSDKKLDLISSHNERVKGNDYYINKNIHLNPTFTIKNNKIYIKINSNFIISNLRLEYIKIPRLIDSRLNQMTDVTITDEILEEAVTLIAGILKDDYYKISENNKQTNN